MTVLRAAPNRIQLAAAFLLIGGVCVIAGTLSGLTAVVDLGGGLLVVALGLLLAAVRHHRRSGWPFTLYRALIVLVLVSIPIGLILAELKTR